MRTAYRGRTLAIAASWVSLARQQIAMDELLAIWTEASTDPWRMRGRYSGRASNILAT
jgi:hypothetical protein